MSELLTARDAIARIPGWDPGQVRIETLYGGLTNRIFRVTRGRKAFVLRLDAAHTQSFNLDRRIETAIMRAAAAAGLAPAIVHADAAAGIMLSEYLHGKVWSLPDLYDTANLDAVGDLLRRVHALPLSGVRLDTQAVAHRYTTSLQDSPDLQSVALRCQAVIADLPATTKFCCCHNDVIAENIIATPQLKLLDWEYACDNHPLFDLASLVGFHQLGPVKAGALLDAYAGGADGELRERLAQQVRVYDAIHWLWLANRQLLSHDRRQAAKLQELQQRLK